MLKMEIKLKINIEKSRTLDIMIRNKDIKLEGNNNEYE